MEKFSKNVIIETVTKQTENGESAVYNNKYKGRLFYKNGDFFIFYEETTEEGQHCADCSIRAGRDKVEIKRTGSFTSLLIYEKGKNHKSVYETPYGGMPVSIKPYRVLTALDENGGKIFLDYVLSLAGQEFENSVVIKISVSQ